MKYAFLFLSLITSATLLAQAKTETKQYYQLFDKIVGQHNTPLSNGTIYREEHVTLNEYTKFLLPEYQEGSLVYYGQPYYDVSLNYNVYDDLLLIRIKTDNAIKNVKLNQKFIDHFEVNGRRFQYIGEEEDIDSGFYEEIYSAGEVKLLKKLRKNLNEKRDKEYKYFEFKDRPDAFYAKNGSNYFQISNQRSWIKAFPDKENLIKAYYKSNSAARRNNKTLFYKSLLSQLYSNTDKEI